MSETPKMNPRRRTPAWPPWYDWSLEISPHVERRMEERGFSEVELREMIERASAYRESAADGRFVLAAAHLGRPWEVVVEPDPLLEHLVVVTAYRKSPE